jgi:RimJ/RimL family protein N-acetyltransferase
MKPIETERLLLRKFTPDDFAAVHSYASNRENVNYMLFGPNTESQTRAFIDSVIKAAEKVPCTEYQYAVVLKKTGNLIGSCTIDVTEGKWVVGWLLHRDHWKQGYGTEIGKALLAFGFDTLNLHRICASCHVDNIGSYRVMEKIGMRREGLFLEARPASKDSNKEYGDELWYAILKDEWDTQKEIAYYNALPFIFNGFIDVPVLSDGRVYLVCTAKAEANPEKKYVPAYIFAVCVDGEKVGDIRLRIGYTDSLYYGGQIGYDIDEKHRGNGYAPRACRLLLPVARAHGMVKLLITNDHANVASRRVCEKIGARLIRVARLPEWFDLYKEGYRFSNIFEWNME